LKTDDRPAEAKNTTTLSEHLFARRVLVALGLVLAVGIFVALIWISIKVWLAVFAGILVAVFLRTLTNLVCKATPLSAVWGLGVVIISLLSLAVLGGWLLVPGITDQFNAFSERLPRALEQAQAKIGKSVIGSYLPHKLPAASELANSAGQMLAKAAAFFSLSVGAIANFFVIIFLGIYLAASPQVYINGVLHLFPFSNRVRAREILSQVGTALGHWLFGQMVSMAVVGTLIGLGLTLLGIPLGLALGVLAGLLNFIPIVGSLLSAAPAVLLAFLVGPLHPVYVILLYVVVNTGIESHLLVPLIQRYAINLPPALAVLALFLMGELFGFFGLLLAIPMAATLMVLIKALYVQDILGDRSVKVTKSK
jgi:predicted PurR-regulated permease PerM